MNLSKKINLALLVCGVFLYLSCKKNTIVPQRIHVTAIDSLTGKLMPNTKLVCVIDYQDEWFDGVDEHEQINLTTDLFGKCIFEIPKSRKAHSVKIITEYSDSICNKYVELINYGSKNPKDYFYDMYLYPRKRNIAYKVIVSFKNSTGNLNDSIFSYGIGDLPDLNLSRRQQSDSTEIRYVYNDDSKQVRKQSFVFRTKINGVMDNCPRGIEQILYSNKMNKVYIEIE